MDTPPQSAEKAVPRRRKSQLDIPLDGENAPIPEDHPLQPEKKPFFAGRQTPTPDEVLQPPKEEPAAEPGPAKTEPAVTPVDLKQATEEVSRQIEQELSEPE